MSETFDWSTYVPIDCAVLLFLFRGEGGAAVRDIAHAREVLLIHKQRGLGAGKINAPGGRVEPGETPAQAAVRECREEVCVEARGPVLAGKLAFQFVDGYALHCTVFTSLDFSGEPSETDEAVPEWFSVDALPYEAMWADDRHWLPLLLSGRAFSGRFVFEGDEMLSMELEPANSAELGQSTS